MDKNGECVSKFTIKVKVSDIMVASQRIPNWWNSKGIWKLTTQNNYDIIRGMNGDDTVYRVNLDPASLKCTINEYTLSAPLGRQHDFGNWTYMAIDVHKDDAFMIISQLDYALNGHIKDNILYSGKVSKNIINYNMEFDKFVIPLKGTDIDMSNIRIYESEYSMENEWQMDMYSRVVQNASKLILVDTPLNANDMSFISPLR